MAGEGGLVVPFLEDVHAAGMGRIDRPAIGAATGLLQRGVDQGPGVADHVPGGVGCEIQSAGDDDGHDGLPLCS
jgi:hypothetical protein